MSIFKGFNIKYPRYSVICPQTGFAYDVRSLNVAEVSKLKTSLTTPSQAPALISEVLWNSIETKPDFITSLEDFKKYTTLRDREALIYGLYQVSFGDDREFSLTCRSCGNVQLLKIKMSKLFSMEAYPGSEAMMNSYKVAKIVDPQVFDPEIEKELQRNQATRPFIKPAGMPDEIAKIHEEEMKDISRDDVDELDMALGKKPENKIEYVPDEPAPNKPPAMVEEKQESSNPLHNSILFKKLEIELPISKIVVTLRQPTIMDEDKILSMVPFAQKKYSDNLNETLVIEKFDEYEDRSKRPIQTITDRDDILAGYNSLPSQDKQKIFDEFQKNFGKYGIELKSQYVCDKCDAENEIDLDIIVQFFRMVGTS